MFGLSPINIIGDVFSKMPKVQGASFQFRILSRFPSVIIGVSFQVFCRTQERGYRPRFPSGLRHSLHMPTLPSPHPTFYNYHRHSVHRPFHHYLPTRHPPKFHPVSLSSATVCSVSLGDNSWIICMPAPPMVIHYGLQALSTALVGQMHNSRILAPLPWPTR